MMQGVLFSIQGVFDEHQTRTHACACHLRPHLRRRPVGRVLGESSDSARKHPPETRNAGFHAGPVHDLGGSYLQHRSGVEGAPT